MNKQPYIAVLDFGSQTTMLIARKVRELGVLAKVFPHTISPEHFLLDPPVAFIFSGSPASVHDDYAPNVDEKIFDLNLPILGICFGMQILVQHAKGTILHADNKEFGQRIIEVDATTALFLGIDKNQRVWMSHGDQVDISHTPYQTIAKSPSCPHAAIMWEQKNIYGVQFHPEVFHSENGKQILSNFILNIACANPDYKLDDFITKSIEDIKTIVGKKQVIMALSGGVDSTVAAVLIHKAIGKNLHCVFVDHGLNRLNEVNEVRALLQDIHNIELAVVNAQEQFFSALKGITDPETKRIIIGHKFIEIFEQETNRLQDVEFLGQGTLYPDVIESMSQQAGNYQAIKSHHNVGGLPKNMNLKLLEPLRDLFKDEVRQIGILLGLPKHVVMRQPFPGPGLAVRVIGEVSVERVKLLQKADALVRQEIDDALKLGSINGLWQWFAILLPIKSVGVMGDARCYKETVVIRCVESQDAMTADWAKLPHDLLQHISSRLTNEVDGISRVLYDITQKPPGTIEWE